MVMAATVRSARASDTRDLILRVAERLYAEQGVIAVSNRQVSEAAGQGNNAAVGYHFGTKPDLIRAIVVKHSARIEVLREQMLNENNRSTELRDWISCLVRPSTRYLETLGRPTWYARFSAQVLTDPTLRPIVYEGALASLSVRTVISELNKRIPALPEDVRVSRSEMARTLMTHVTAERERELAYGRADSSASWHDCGTELVDALTGLWLAPVSRVR